MVSSESINFSKYAMIKGQNSILLPENNSTNNNQEIVDEESQVTYIKSDNSENDKNKLLQEERAGPYTLFGNDIKINHPRHLGKTFAFFYDSKGEPRIIIGPDCKRNYNL